MDTLKMLIVATGTGMFANGTLQTGLWLSELTHMYKGAEEQKYEITLASPRGGDIPVDPESIKPVALDKLSKQYWDDPGFRDKLQHAKRLDEVSGQLFDCVYLAGGHGAMYDFPGNVVLQAILRDHYEAHKIVAAICHGVSGLLNVKMSDEAYLIKDKRITGFSWFEESIAGRKEEVPFNLEAELKKRGADYEKAYVPMRSKVVVSRNLITGENPFSSKEMAEVVIEQLEGKK